MARRPYAHLVGDLSGWPKGAVPTPRILRNLDQYSTELINGEDGGTYAPTSPIVVGNTEPTAYYSSDLTLADTDCLIEGDVETLAGNDIGDVGYQAGLILEAGALPTFQTSRTRIVVVPFGFFTEQGNENGSALLGMLHTIDPITLGAKTADSPYQSGGVVLTVALPFNARHRAATITQVDFRYVIAGQRTAMPAGKPKFRVARASSSAVSTMHTAAGAYDANGWYTDQAASVTDYVNANNTRIASYVPNQNNTSIDPTTYSYFAQITIESPFVGGIGNLYLSATVMLSTIADMRQE